MIPFYLFVLFLVKTEKGRSTTNGNQTFFDFIFFRQINTAFFKYFFPPCINVVVYEGMK